LFFRRFADPRTAACPSLRALCEGWAAGAPPFTLDVYIRLFYSVYTLRADTMAITMTTIRLDTDLADEAVKVLGAKSRTDAVHIALREIVALKRFKALMRKDSGKLKFSGLDE